MQISDGLTIILFAIAVMLYFGGNIWFIAEAFRKGIGWGLAVIFIPFAAVAFLLTTFDRALKPFALTAVSLAVFVLLFTANANFRSALHMEATKHTQIAEVTSRSLTPAPAAEKIAPPIVKTSVAKHAHQHSSGKHHKGQ